MHAACDVPLGSRVPPSAERKMPRRRDVVKGSRWHAARRWRDDQRADKGQTGT
ncbi:MAG: hypothetical protein ACPIOQ_63260 [Promethearchaeia archaeon]